MRRRHCAMLTVGSLVADCGLELVAGDDERRAADSLGPHLRARGPDAVALRRRAPADDRDPARRAPPASAASRPARRPRGGRPRAWDGVRAQACAQGARRRGRRSAACRCSRSRTRCRSSRSPSAPSRGSSTSSTRCSSAAPQVHERLERLVIEGRGLEAVLGSRRGRDRRRRDRAGRRRARARPAARQGRPERGGAEGARRRDRGRGRRPATVTAFEPSSGRWPSRALAVPVPGRRGGAPVAWLVVVSRRRAARRVRAADRPAGRDRRRARADARAGRPGDRAPPRRRPAGGGAGRPARRRRAARPPAARSGSAPRRRCWSSTSRTPTPASEALERELADAGRRRRWSRRHRRAGARCSAR